MVRDLKGQQERLNRLWHRWLLPLLIAVTSGCASVLAVEHVLWLNELEGVAVQDRLTQGASPPPNSDILLITVGDSSLDNAGAPPGTLMPPRTLVAELLTLLDKAGAKVAIVDYFFKSKNPDQDPQLIGAIQGLKRMHVILPTDSEDKPDVATPSQFRHWFVRLPVASEDGPRVTIGHALALESGPHAIGAVMVLPDEASGRLVPHLSLAAVMAWAGVPPSSARLDTQAWIVSAGHLEWHVNRNGALHAIWTSHPNPFPSLDVADALKRLRSGEETGRFNGRLVIFGDIRPEIDSVQTLKYGEIPGVYFVAQMVNTALLTQSRQMAFLPGVIAWAWPVLVAALAALSIFSMRIGFAVAGALLAAGMAYAVPVLIAAPAGYALATVPALLAVFISALVAGVIASARGPKVEHRPAGLVEEATVMFVDLHNSTVLTQQLGAERYSRLHAQLNRILHREIERKGGKIERTTGDGVFAVFRARSNPEHALSCAKSVGPILAGVSGLSAEMDGQEVTLSIGIESGMVSGGYVIEGGRKAWSSAGDAVNMAQRLQSGCDRWGVKVAIGPVASRLIQPRFRTTPLGRFKLKGFAEPVQVFSIPDGFLEGGSK